MKLEFVFIICLSIYSFIYVHCASMNVPWYASLGSEDNLQELVLSFNHVKLRGSNLGHCPLSGLHLLNAGQAYYHEDTSYTSSLCIILDLKEY